MWKSSGNQGCIEYCSSAQGESLIVCIHHRQHTFTHAIMHTQTLAHQAEFSTYINLQPEGATAEGVVMKNEIIHVKHLSRSVKAA